MAEGKVNISLNQNSLVFCNKMDQWLDYTQDLYSEAIDVSKEIN